MLLAIFFFLLWTILWSFWSVLLFRLSKDTSLSTIASIIGWRSYDDTTWRLLRRDELIPIYSWIKQRGKSTQSAKKLSTLYIVLEIVVWLVTMCTYIALTQAGLIDFTIWVWIDILMFWIGVNFLLTLLLIRDIYTLYLHFPVWIITISRILGRELSMGTTLLGMSAISTVSLVSIFLIIYFLAKLYAQKRYNMAEWLWEWDIWLWAIIWLLFPFIFMYHQTIFSGITLAYTISLYFAFSSIAGIIGYLIQSYFSKNKSDRTLPFFPGLIVWFWFVLLSFSFWW